MLQHDRPQSLQELLAVWLEEMIASGGTHYAAAVLAAWASRAQGSTERPVLDLGTDEAIYELAVQLRLVVDPVLKSPEAQRVDEVVQRFTQHERAAS